MNVLSDPYICSLAPTLTYQALMRVDTSFTALSDGFFQSDCEWFRRHMKRKLFIRRESKGEFDGVVEQAHRGFSVSLDKPRLWVLVSQLAPGTNLCIPVYRGAAFWSENLDEYPKPHVAVPAVANDEEIAALLVEMQRRNGINLQEFDSWLKAYETAVNAQRPAKAIVH